MTDLAARDAVQPGAAPAAWRRLRPSWRSLQLPLSFVLLLGAWEAVVDGFGVPVYLVPAPSAVAVSFAGMVGSGLLLSNTLVTFGEAIAGFLLGGAAAAVFAVLISEFAACERLVYPYFAGLQSMPKVAIAPLIVIWFGYGTSSKVVLSALLAFFPMLVNFVQGLRAADPGRLRLMRALDASRWQVLRLVRVPYALPFFLAGMELGSIYALLGAIVGEFIGARAGLGYWLMAMNMNIDTAGTFALLVLLAVYGIVIQRGIGRLRRRTLFWAQQDRRPSDAGAEG